jgi:hypothetical protein
LVPGLKLPKHLESFAPHEMPVPVTVPAPDTATDRRAVSGGTNLVVVAAGSVAITGSTAGSVVVGLGTESPGVPAVVTVVVVAGVVVVLDVDVDVDVVVVVVVVVPIVKTGTGRV